MSAESLWAALVVLLVAVLAGDAYLVKKKKPTMSRRYWDIVRDRPFIPFLIGALSGFLSGHLNWQGEDCVKWMSLPPACMEQAVKTCEVQK